MIIELMTGIVVIYEVDGAMYVVSRTVEKHVLYEKLVAITECRTL
jgi:hypothetical protein